MIIMKFGGTSIQDNTAIKRISETILQRKNEHPAVVVSAIGNSTDSLEEMSAVAAQKDRRQAYALVIQFISFHKKLAHSLGCGDDSGLQAVFESVEGDLRRIVDIILQSGHVARHIRDELSSLGEYCSAHIITAYLNSIGCDSRVVDARDVIVTDSQFGNAHPLVEESSIKIKKILKPVAEEETIAVIQGFIGRDPFGRTTTLGRGGSDYSATFIGSILKADRVEIWSDVDGVLTADPSIVPHARRILYMSFQEAAELAYFGAKVLHPSSLLPAIEHGIPVRVLNSNRPDYAGTEISDQKPKGQQHCVLKSIAYKENITVIKVSSTRMLMAYGFIASIFEIFERYQTPVDLISTSEVSVSITIDDTSRLSEIRRELSRFAQVEVLPKKAIVCLVGEALKRETAVTGNIFTELSDFVVYQISHGASDINISFVIDEENISPVVNTLHNLFFKNGADERLFGSEL